jgi:hypothetical protein
MNQNSIESKLMMMRVLLDREREREDKSWRQRLSGREDEEEDLASISPTFWRKVKLCHRALFGIKQGWPDFFVQGPYLKNIFECGPHFLTSYCYM